MFSEPAQPCLLWDYQAGVRGGGGVKVAMGRTPCGPGMPVRSGEESRGRQGEAGGHSGMGQVPL